jgi:hypothetical protein
MFLSRCAVAAALLAALPVLAAPTWAVPSAKELEQLLLQERKPTEVFRTGCFGVTGLFDRGDVFDTGGGNPFKAFATFRIPQPGQPASRELAWLRALAAAGVLSVKPFDWGGLRTATFRVTDEGWRTLRPGNGLCFDFGVYDRLRIENIREDRANRRVFFEYVIGYSGPQALMPWARGAAVQQEIPLLRTFITRGDRVPAHVEADAAGRWKFAYGDAPRRVPQPEPAEVLRLAKAAIPDLSATQACFPLPQPRPQLGIAVRDDSPGYAVEIEPMANPNSTQQEFRSRLAGQLDDWAAAGLLEKRAPRSYRASARLQKFVLGSCLAIGVIVPQVVRAQAYQLYEDDAFFKIQAPVEVSAEIASQHPKVLQLEAVAQFVERGVACDGWMRWRNGWSIARTTCYDTTP